MSDRGRSPSAGAGTGSQSPRQQSQSPLRSGSRGSSPGRSAAGPPSGYPAALGFDPAKLTSASADREFNKRLELPPDAYADPKKDLFPLRGNKLNTEGRPETIEVNQYRMTKFDFNKKIYQYDVVVSPSPSKLGPVLKKIKSHTKFEQALAKYSPRYWLFDGSKLAWAPVLVDRGEIRVKVDLDEGKTGPSRGDNQFYITIRQTTEIQMSALQGYLDRKIAYGNSVQEALNFMDHLIRQWPSENMVAIRRNFYNRSESGRPLLSDNIVEVRKGTYASLRLSHNLAGGGLGLSLNTDVANTCFWVGKQSVADIIPQFLMTLDPGKWRGIDHIKAHQALKPVRGDNKLTSSDAFKQMRKLRKLKFRVVHPNRADTEKLYTIMDFAFDPNYGPDGGTARNVRFDCNGRQISIFEYYQEKYKVTLKWAHLPLIATSKKNEWFPMELAFIEPFQRYPFKLNPDQTAAMIKIAVTRPQQRKGDIQRNVAGLQLQKDPYLNFYGVQFDQQFAKTDAKILPPPQVNFSAGPPADPKFSGRWDLRGKKFWQQNRAPLNSWGFICMDNCVQFPVLQQFASSFRQAFLGHGGKCDKDAMLIKIPGNIANNAAQAVEFAFNAIGKERGYPQLLFIVVRHKNSPYYERLKKSADCRFGILSQVVNAKAVETNNGQYHSNVCMKVNAKLGGATSRTMPPWKIAQPKASYFPASRPTVIMGVDVSHAAPGAGAPSTAAMTMSVDPDATRYAAMVETNGFRVEMLTPANIDFMFGQLINQWKSGHPGQFPAHIIYFRDGVAEGQFVQVLEREIKEIKRWFNQMVPGKPIPKFTVVVATKRHHIRFFPQKGDKNGNAMPGTLVEKEVTHPFMWDFYLSSHVAIQGTARPVHYHIIQDELGVPVNEFQKMIYHQCYSYARSTTPVSMHPAVYYAHLACNRARAHEHIASSEGFRSGAKGHEVSRDRVAKGEQIAEQGPVCDPLLPLGGKVGEGGAKEGEARQRDFFRATMWYI